MQQDSDRDDAAKPSARRRTPHWILVVGFVLVVLAILAAVQHLTGGGIRNHIL